MLGRCRNTHSRFSSTNRTSAPQTGDFGVLSAAHSNWTVRRESRPRADVLFEVRAPLGGKTTRRGCRLSSRNPSKDDLGCKSLPWNLLVGTCSPSESRNQSVVVGQRQLCGRPLHRPTSRRALEDGPRTKSSPMGCGFCSWSEVQSQHLAEQGTRDSTAAAGRSPAKDRAGGAARRRAPLRPPRF
jgi:hypothetical protein